MKLCIQSMMRCVRTWICTQRTADTKWDRIVNVTLMSLFPFLLVILTELNHLQSFGALWAFLTEHFGVFLLDAIMLGLLFFALTALMRRAWIAATVLGGFFYLLSCVEFFKYDVSRSHFLPADMALAGNLGDVAGMAKLYLTAFLIVDLLVLAASVLVFWLRNCNLTVRISQRLLTAAICLVCVTVAIVTPLSSVLYGFFGLDQREAVSTFTANVKFKNNRLLAFWISELSQMAQSGLSAPKGYSQESIGALLASAEKPLAENLQAHNVIIVMSESYGDFRALSSSVGDLAYEAFDAMMSEGFGGTAVVPTFGGYTVRSEFELIAGLPSASLKDPVEPHRVIKRETVEAIPALFADLGYKTFYLHPYAADFYDRDTVYPTFGFDTLLFEDSFAGGERTRYGRADDAVCFEKTVEIIAETEEPTFLFVTTMQNHQPYYYESDHNVDEMTFYMEGIAETDRALEDFHAALDALGEPTILLYVGDHLPFFGLEGNFYEEYGYGEENYDALYRQSYLIYANYELDGRAVPQEEISLFYLPHLLMQLAVSDSVPTVSAAIWNHAESVPVYTTVCMPNERAADPFLDAITYDRVIGAAYSANPLY